MLKMRLTRIGKKKKPFYRVVIAPSNAPREGQFVEIIGHYNPIPDPAEIKFNEERAIYWLKTGVQPTERVKKLLQVQGVWQKFSGADAPAAPADNA